MELFDDMWNSKDIVRDSYLFASQENVSSLGDENASGMNQYVKLTLLHK